MSFKELLFTNIEKFLEENENYTKKDLLSVVSKSFDEGKKLVAKKLKVKNVKEEKEKKPLTAYQVFVKTTLKTLKEREDAKAEGEDKLKQKDLMKEVGELWKASKVSKDDL